MSAAIQAMRAALAAQVSAYDKGGLRFHVTRREDRVDVTFETVTPDGAVRHPDMAPLWAFTAVVTPTGLRLVEQEQGSGEDARQFFPSLASHLDARATTPVPEALDTRYVRVGGFKLRARRFNRGWVEVVRVDLRVRWTDDGSVSWMHAFDAELVSHPFGGSASLRVTEASEVLEQAWGQAEHLVRFAVYAALQSSAPSPEVLQHVADTLAWGSVEGLVFATPAPTPPGAPKFQFRAPASKVGGADE